MKRIDSRGNPMFQALKSCLTSKGIQKERLAVVSGAKNVREFLETRPTPCRAMITAPKHKASPPRGMEHIELHGDLFQEIDVLGTRGPLLWVDAPEIPRWEPASGFAASGLHLLVPFQDPENTGAVIRHAVAFGAASIVLLREAAHPFLPKAIRSSAGTVFHAPLVSGPALEDLPSTLPIIGLSTEGASIGEAVFPDTFALLPGLEGQGLPESFRGRALAIPMRDSRVESLNAAAAVAIALYVWSQGENAEH